MLKLNIILGTSVVFGLFLTIMAGRMKSTLTECNANAGNRLHAAINGILVIGVILMVFGVTVSGLMFKGLLRTHQIELRLIYILAILLFLGITLITLGAIVQDETKNECDALKKLAPPIYVFGILFVISSIGFFVVNRKTMKFARERQNIADMFTAFKNRKENNEAPKVVVEEDVIEDEFD